MLEILNSGKFDGDNDMLAGTTPGCGGRIDFNNGKSFIIIGCSDYVEIQRNDNSKISVTRAYFLKTFGLKDFIKTILINK